MSLATGTRLGPYEILSPIGAGGMGEVYRARDTRLGRDVAIKILPEGFAANPERLRRFEAEARTASAISDPHIVTVFDVGHEGGVSFIATELVEGSDLRAMLAGPLPTRRALDIAGQIAAGLAAAHEKGIVHRDLKPENVLVTKSGLAKVADFGLAKLAENPDVERSRMPTASRVETSEGVVMGTVSYMSPEQAAGRKVDHRSDQFSFGLILYEMLTGKTAFRRETAGETLAAILRDEPEPVLRAGPSVPPPLGWVVERCLSKDPEERYASTRDLARELSVVQAHLSDAAPAPATAGRAHGGRAERVAWSAAVAILLAAIAALLLRPGRAGGFAGRMRASIVLAGESGLRAAALSPDGSSVAFVARETSGTRLLAIRPIDSLSLRLLPGTENATSPFWSPDGRSIGFFADGKLKRIDAAGGPPQTITDAPISRGGSWNRDGVILFSPVPDGPLYRVSAQGGPATLATHFDPGRGETSHRWPFFLPDGRHFLFEAASFGPGAQAEKMGVYVGALDSPEVRFLLRVSSSAAYVPSAGDDARGDLLFVRDRNLFAQPFDASGLRLTGDARSVAEGIEYFPEIHEAVYSASRNGLLLYGSQSAPRVSQLTWRDRNGGKRTLLGRPGNQANPRISPDGRSVALDVVDPRTGNLDVWVYPEAGGAPSRLTSDPALDSTPLWSPDGTRIVFTSMRRNHPDLFRKSSTGAGTEDPVLLSGDIKFASDWSPDGRFLLYTSLGERSNFELWTMPADGDRRPTPFLKAAYGVKDGQFSPDGKWVAYATNESGRWEIVVASFPLTGRNWKVSTAGGSEPRWRRDGKELFYLAPDGKLMAVGVQEGQDFEAGIAAPLFDIRRPDPVSSTDLYCYDVSADGERFLVNEDVTDPSPPALTLVVNWMTGPGR